MGSFLPFKNNVKLTKNSHGYCQLKQKVMCSRANKASRSKYHTQKNIVMHRNRHFDLEI